MQLKDQQRTNSQINRVIKSVILQVSAQIFLQVSAYRLIFLSDHAALFFFAWNLQTLIWTTNV